MLMIHSGLFWGHIVFGSIALILFWVPLFTKKGQLNHVKYGHFFKSSMYIVAISGMLMSLMVIVAPLQIKVEAQGAADPEAVKANIRLFWGFLGLLGLLTFVTTRHGIAALLHKDNRAKMRNISYLLPVFMMLGIGSLYVYLGFAHGRVLYIIFGFLSVGLSIGVLKYVLKAHAPARAWILEHISGMLGSGIAAYTAFLTFGSRRLLDLGDYQVLVWIAPGVIGSIASYFLCKKYARVFSINRMNNKKPA